MENEQEAKPKKKYFDNISVGNRTKQEIYFAEDHDKNQLCELFMQKNSDKRTVIITKSKKKANELASFFKEKNREVVAVHGNSRKEDLEKISLQFNTKEINILITTELIFFTLELKDIELIINFELPFEIQNYFKTLLYVDEIGTAVSFVSSQEEKMVDLLELMMKYNIPQLEIEAFKHTPLPKQTTSKKEKNRKPRHKKKSKRNKD